MAEQDIGKALLNLDSGVPARDPDTRQLARTVIARDQRRVRLLTGLTILLWLLAAAGVFFVVYVALWHLYPKEHKLVQEVALGNLTAEQIVALQTLHFQAMRICTLVIAAAFAAITLAALCTVLLILVSRRATLRQINANLAEVSEQLKLTNRTPGSTA
jgi:Na+/proline symporter